MDVLRWQTRPSILIAASGENKLLENGYIYHGLVTEKKRKGKKDKADTVV